MAKQAICAVDDGHAGPEPRVDLRQLAANGATTEDDQPFGQLVEVSASSLVHVGTCSSPTTGGCCGLLPVAITRSPNPYDVPSTSTRPSASRPRPRTRVTPLSCRAFAALLSSWCLARSFALPNRLLPRDSRCRRVQHRLARDAGEVGAPPAHEPGLDEQHGPPGLRELAGHGLPGRAAAEHRHVEVGHLCSFAPAGCIGSTPGGTERRMTAAKGVLFDVDGTLVDTSYQHTIAWWQALRDAGLEVPMREIHRAIGMGSEPLLEHLIGRTDEDITLGHDHHYAPYLERVQAFAGAGDLLRACKQRGLVVALATSSEESQLGRLRRGIAADEAIDVVTTGSDVERTKPAPDLVQVALEQASLRP